MAKWTTRNHKQAFDKLTEKALSAIGVFLEGEAIVRCPVDTGRLRGSITWAIRHEHSIARSPATQEDAVDIPHDKYTLYVGTNVEYAPYVEYGAKRRTSRTGALSALAGRIAAQPYLRPALDDNRRRVLKLFHEAFRKEYGKR